MSKRRIAAAVIAASTALSLAQAPSASALDYYYPNYTNTNNAADQLSATGSLAALVSGGLLSAVAEIAVPVLIAVAGNNWVVQQHLVPNVFPQLNAH